MSIKDITCPPLGTRRFHGYPESGDLNMLKLTQMSEHKRLQMLKRHTLMQGEKLG